MGAFEDALKDLSKLGIKVIKLGDHEIEPIEVIPTGSFKLNSILGIGGYPKGKLIELFGKETSGKSLLSLLAIANVQKKGGKAVLFDIEQSFDPKWATKFGVDVDNLYVSQPDTAEQTLEACIALCNTKEVDLIVIDSTAALIPKAELEDDIEKAGIALLARVMSKGLKKLVKAAADNKTCVIFINQLRDTPGVMFGETSTTPGGRALKFFATIRLQVTVKSKIKKDEAIIGQVSEIRIKKNKMAPPFKSMDFRLYYDTGIDLASELLETALEKGIIGLEGKTYSFGDMRWVGQEQTRLAIEADPTLQKKLMDLLDENKSNPA